MVGEGEDRRWRINGGVAEEKCVGGGEIGVVDEFDACGWSEQQYGCDEKDKNGNFREHGDEREIFCAEVCRCEVLWEEEKKNSLVKRDLIGLVLFKYIVWNQSQIKEIILFNEYMLIMCLKSIWITNVDKIISAVIIWSLKNFDSLFS